ncbi:MAG: cytochrome C assembly family protein [Woeseiaceae bacterium]
MYIIAGICFTLTRLPRFSESLAALVSIAFSSVLAGLLWHAMILYGMIMRPDGLALSIGNTASLIGLQLALIAVIGAIEPTLRGLAGGLCVLAALAGLATGWPADQAMSERYSWQLESHILVSIFSYGLLAAGAIIAVYALIQDRRLKSGRLSSVNQLFAPLETTERLLFGITSAGFALLLLAVVSGFWFVDNLFAQHLVHKTVLSLLALLLFGVLIAGRQFTGWRGSRAVYLYLGGFGILCLAYFGSRFILENVLGRSWG